MDIVTILIAAIIVGAIIGVFVILVQKDNARLAGLVEALTAEQKERIEAAEVAMVEGKADCWTQEALIVQATPKGKKTAVVALYCNRVIPNDTMDKICHADLNVDTEVFHSQNLGVGSYVNLFIDPNKGAELI